ncbi:MAG: hypothetical protein Q9201_000853 [Fulgogasparrea decipioides]
MVYDWEGKEETMMDLYIHQGKSLEEVMEWFKVNQNFTPSKRAFQTQIKKWNFPSKHVPAHTDAALVDRVRQLWAQNVSQKNMLLTLHNEGYQDITERELTRIRDREGLKLRVASVKETPKSRTSTTPAEARLSESMNARNASVPSTQAQNGADATASRGSLESPRPEAVTRSPPLTELDEEVLQKRRAWHQKLEAESLERLEKRTRRRRTKEYAGLPPDPPAPPRFPSETTLEEAKAILQLDKSTYTGLRIKFEEICRQHNVIKKTEAGHDKWQSVKHQLIDESPSIQTLFQVPDQQQLNNHFLALEMICNDVTKKLRTMKSKVTIADAKNVLGLDPEQGRQIKAAFHRILRADHFTSKLEAGPEHWQGLKQKWIDGSPLLQAILAPGDADPKHAQKVKAMEHLCRDVMKRLRDSQTREEKRRKTGDVADQGASPQAIGTTTESPAPDPPRQPKTNGPPCTSQGARNVTVSPGGDYGGISTLASQALASTQLPISPPASSRHQQPPSSHDYSGQIDPTLLSAAANLPTSYQAPQPVFPPTPVYFRLAPNSQVKTPPTVWVETLTSPTMSGLRQLAVANRPYSNIKVVRVEGLIKAESSETKLTIGDDDELRAYMEHLKGETPTFVVNISYDA